jgi:hypothetical protein
MLSRALRLYWAGEIGNLPPARGFAIDRWQLLLLLSGVVVVVVVLLSLVGNEVLTKNQTEKQWQLKKKKYLPRFVLLLLGLVGFKCRGGFGNQCGIAYHTL